MAEPIESPLKAHVVGNEVGPEVQLEIGLDGLFSITFDYSKRTFDISSIERLAEMSGYNPDLVAVEMQWSEGKVLQFRGQLTPQEMINLGELFDLRLISSNVMQNLPITRNQFRRVQNMGAP